MSPELEKALNEAAAELCGWTENAAYEAGRKSAMPIPATASPAQKTKEGETASEQGKYKELLREAFDAGSIREANKPNMPTYQFHQEFEEWYKSRIGIEEKKDSGGT